MSNELIAILGMGVTILIATWTMNRSLRNELKQDMEGLDSRIGALDSRVGALGERMAHLEGLLEGLREAISGRSAA